MAPQWEVYVGYLYLVSGIYALEDIISQSLDHHSSSSVFA